MSIRGLNHLTLATADLDRGVAFYRDVLGLCLEHRWPGGAYFSAGTLWLCLSPETAVPPRDCYTHAAFDVAQQDFDAMARRVRASGATIWKDNTSEGPSLYFADPDGHRLELHTGTLQSRLAAMTPEMETC